jgi:hypothetical protein
MHYTSALNPTNVKVNDMTTSTANTKFETLGKEALRAECRTAGISYGKLNNDGMRAALVAHYEVKVDVTQGEVETEEDFTPVASANLFGALMGGTVAPVTPATGVKFVDGKKVDPKVEAEKAQPRERIEKTPAPFVPKVIRKGYKIETDRPVQNGVKRPSKGTVCGQVWDTFDSTTELTAAKLPAIADANKWNRTNVVCEFYAWRKFNGIRGRQS